MTGAILLSGGEVLTMQQECGETISAPKVGWVGVVGERIEMLSYSEEDAEAFKAKYSDCKVIDCNGMVIMPGLINTHTHVSMTLMRNMADDMELMDWLNNHIWPFEARQSLDDIRAGAKLGIAEMLLGGTTSFVDMYWTEHAIADAVEQMGIRALLGESVLDGREDSFKENMTLLVERCKGSRLMRPAVAPHAPYTCNAATLRLSADIAQKYDVPLMIHISESPSERGVIEERYGINSPLEYITQNGALTERTILAHAIHLTEEEIAKIAESGAAVAHNAQSNMKLASGVAPIMQMKDAGVLCSIATDSASSNNDLNMWEEMRTTALLQRVATLNPLALSAYEVLYMATRGGAKAIGLDGEVGVLKEGALADIIAVDLTAPHLRPRHNTISSLIYCATASDVRHVVVNGALRIENRTLLGHHLNDIISDAETRAFALR